MAVPSGSAEQMQRPVSSDLADEACNKCQTCSKQSAAN
jgi:hypothetical protein